MIPPENNVPWIELETLFSFLKTCIIWYFIVGIVIYAMELLRVKKCFLATFGGTARDELNGDLASAGRCRKLKVLLVTAHPDDECMFFAPSILALSSEADVHLLCVTSGNYYGKGAIRRKELLESCRILRIARENITIFDNRLYPDDPHPTWDTEQLKLDVCSHVQTLQPDFIFTFDERGVSGHPNHISVARVLKQMLLEKMLPQSVQKVFSLETVHLWRKYLSFLDLPVSLLTRECIFVSSPLGVLRSQYAMFAHRTQFVWFRILYIIFSRYMVINTLVPLDT